MAMTTMRDELIKLHMLLIDAFPDCSSYYRALEELKSGVARTRPYPLAWFARDLFDRCGFELTNECLMEHVSSKSKSAVTTYSYESAVYPDIAIELKRIAYTPEVQERLRGRKHRVVTSPSGDIKCIEVYVLWHANNGYWLKEYSTQNEIYFCQYLLTRIKVVELMDSFKLKTDDYVRFTRGNISVDFSFGMKRFTVSLDSEDMQVYEGARLSELQDVLAGIDKGKLWRGDYEQFRKSSMKGVLGL